MAVPQKRKQQGDEEELFNLIKKVKYNNDEPAYDVICKYMRPYIDLFCKKFVIAGLGCDDIEQECLCALKYKAIDDFNPVRGTFKTFAVLCIKRHLFSLIKGNNQHKKKVLNISLSLDEGRSDNGEQLMLRNLIVSDEDNVDDQIQKREDDTILQDKLMDRLSDFEKDVFVLYIQKYHYDEIAEILRRQGRKNIRVKAIDNACVRIKTKAKNITKKEDFWTK